MKASHLPVYCSSSFSWRGNKGSCNGTELIKLGEEQADGEYKGVIVRSSKTGEVKYFDPIYDEDGYDGELMIYGCDNIFIEIWNY